MSVSVSYLTYTRHDGHLCIQYTNRIGLTKSVTSIKNLSNWSVLYALHLILFVKCHTMTVRQSYLFLTDDFQFYY